MPAPIPDRVVHRCSDRPLGQFYVRAALKQRPRDIHVVVARRPVQRALATVIVVAPDVRVRAPLDEQAHHLRAAWRISRPNGRDVKHRPPSIARQTLSGEAWSCVQRAPERR